MCAVCSEGLEGYQVSKCKGHYDCGKYGFVFYALEVPICSEENYLLFMASQRNLYEKTQSYFMALWTIANAQIATDNSLTKLYIATFDRAPDTVGLEYWIQSWLSLEEIAQSFFEQQETLEKYNGKSNRELIDIVYLNLFQREVDEEGLLYWQNALETQAVSRDKFILATMNGALGDDAILLNTKTTIWVSCQKSITREKFDTDDKYIAFLKEIINAPYALESWSCLLDEPVIVQDTLPTITKPTLVTRTEDSITVKGDITDSDGVKYTKTYRAYINNEEIASNTTGKFTDLEADTKYYFTIEWKVQNGASWDWEVVQSPKSSAIKTKEVVVNSYTPYTPPVTNQAPDAIIEIFDGYTTTIAVGEITKLDASSSIDSDWEISSYRWYNDADDTLGTEATYSYTWSSIWDENIHLEVTDNDWAKDTATQIIETYDINPLPTITFWPDVTVTDLDVILLDWKDYIDVEYTNVLEWAEYSISWHEDFHINQENGNIYYTWDAEERVDDHELTVWVKNTGFE